MVECLAILNIKSLQGKVCVYNHIYKIILKCLVLKFLPGRQKFSCMCTGMSFFIVLLFCFHCRVKFGNQKLQAYFLII